MTRPKHIRSRPYYVPEDEREYLLSLFEAGVPAREIHRRTGRAIGTVLAWAAKAGLHEPRTIQRISKKDTAKIIRLYQTGKGGEAIGGVTGIRAGTVRNVLKRNGVPRRGPQEMHERPYPLWEGAFDKLTPESAYWIGFLMADGNVNTTDYRVFLGLSEKDIGHVRKFRSFMRSLHPITTGLNGVHGKLRRPRETYRYAHYAFYSKCVVESLAQWGIVPRKSLTAIALGGVENSRDFWRGLVDGDGSLGWWTFGTKHRYPGFSLVGSNPMMRQFASWVRQTLGFRLVVRRRGNASSVSCGGRHAAQVVSVLYQGSSVHLDRKKALADQFSAPRNHVHKEIAE